MLKYRFEKMQKKIHVFALLVFHPKYFVIRCISKVGGLTDTLYRKWGWPLTFVS